MTLSFDSTGRYVPWRERAKAVMETTETIEEARTRLATEEIQTEVSTHPSFEFEVMVGTIPNHPRALGHASRWRIDVSASEVAKYVWTWLKAEHGCLPLIETVIDQLSETSVHELVHLVGDTWHGHKLRGAHYGWPQRDFEFLTATLGHPPTLKIDAVRRARWAKNWQRQTKDATKRMRQGLIVVDLEGKA